MSDFSIGSVSPLPVDDYDEFDRPNTVEMVLVLDNTTNADNEIMQQGSRPRKRASLSGHTRDRSVINGLRGYYDSRVSVTFTDCYGDDYAVRVLELDVKAEILGWARYTMTLVNDPT